MRLFDDIDKHGVWKDDTKARIIISKAKLARNELLKSSAYTRERKIYRLAGQSGSGKTTQLLPAILASLTAQNKSALILGVRTFAKYHPDYENIATTCSHGEMRARTNGFALKCLVATLSLIARRGVLIVLDLTIHDRWLEQFVIETEKKYGYLTDYHVLAVHKSISDYHIEKRKNNPSSPEFGKSVNKTSANIWYTSLVKGVKVIATHTPDSKCYIWTAQDRMPIYVGAISGAEPSIIKGRKTKTMPIISEHELLNAKIAFLETENI